MPATEVPVGARVLVAPGQRMPADGVVMSGASTADESMLTGEVWLLPWHDCPGISTWQGLRVFTIGRIKFRNATLKPLLTRLCRQRLWTRLLGMRCWAAH